MAERRSVALAALCRTSLLCGSAVPQVPQLPLVIPLCIPVPHATVLHEPPRGRGAGEGDGSLALLPLALLGTRRNGPHDERDMTRETVGRVERDGRAGGETVNPATLALSPLQSGETVNAPGPKKASAAANPCFSLKLIILSSRLQRGKGVVASS